MNFILCVFFAVIGSIICRSPEEGNLYEGDIELNPVQMAAVKERAKGNAFASIKNDLWKTNGKVDTINYYIDPAISGATSAITEAIADYHKFTCLRFVRQYTKPSGPHIFFTTGSGCSSPVGKYSNGNSIRLAQGCWYKGTIIHEIGHSLGLFHEQSRPDRDNYVEILWNNITPEATFNFNKEPDSKIDSKGTPYDYDSIMHYGGSFFQKQSGLITIKTKDSSKQNRIGQRNGFSAIDKIQINKMYC